MLDKNELSIAAFLVGMYAGVALVNADTIARVAILVITAMLFAVYAIGNLRERKRNETKRKTDNRTRHELDCK